MKIELNQNKIFYNNGKSIQEIHPFWLRERVDGEEFLDKGTQQRLFDPSLMNGEIIVNLLLKSLFKLFQKKEMHIEFFLRRRLRYQKK